MFRTKEQLFQQAKKLGLKVSKGMTKDQISELLLEDWRKREEQKYTPVPAPAMSIVHDVANRLHHMVGIVPSVSEHNVVIRFDPRVLVEKDEIYNTISLYLKNGQYEMDLLYDRKHVATYVYHTVDSMLDDVRNYVYD